MLGFMSDADALLAAVLADPDADLPRLVYADWLEERGEAERAEFIRVQVELARDRGADNTRRIALWGASWRCRSSTRKPGWRRCGRRGRRWTG